ncbi:MAG: tetratricopeptide repeat protein [Coleofasciculus sp. Co-bin14]|nr:tetratricopeptide repeat protein [Coleofasciculus sp. Co-bin14]
MSRNTALRVVSLTMSSGVELNAYLVMDEKPTRIDQKLKTLTQYVQQYPSGWKKRLELANLLYARGRIEQAVEKYRQVISRQQPLIGVRLKLGKLLQLMGREVEAVAVYESALPSLRNQATRQHIGGLIAVCRGDTTAAILAFESAAFLEPDNAAHWLALGQVQMGREEAVAALRVFDRVLSLNPDNIVALMDSYDALMLVGNVREAQRRLSRVLELAPGDFRALKRLANTRCRMRLVSEEAGKQTKQMISCALQLAPDAVDAHELLAYYHLFRGEWAKGVEVLARFTEEHPHNPRGWYSYGRCLFHTGEYQGAASAMLKAYRLYPTDCEIYRALCEILPVTSPSIPLDPPQPPLKRGEQEEAKLSNFTGETPLKVPLDKGDLGGSNPPPKVLLFKGDLGGSNCQVTLASIVEEILERFPERWSVWATAGRVLVESFQEIERGCSVSLQGTQLQPQLPAAWLCHGRVLALSGKHREAVEALQQGWQLLPQERGYLQSVSAAVWLGESYRVLEDEVASRKWLEQACQFAQELMEFDPAMVCYWQGRALSGLGDVQGAVEAYRSALRRQLLYPFRGEVESALKRLKGRKRKGSRSKA